MKKFFLMAIVSLFLLVPGFAQDSTTSSSETTKKPAVFRPTKDQIMQVQGILKTKKLYSGEANGKYNDATRDGIKGFQKSNGLKETGTLNRATLEKFGVELTESQKAMPVLESSYASGDTETEKVKTVKTSSKTETTSSKTEKTSSTGDKSKKPAVFRATKDQINEAQRLLKAKGMYAGEETGKLDDATREGLGKFQEANSMKVTKTLNAATLEKMGIALTDAQKANVAAAAAYEAAKNN